MKNSCFVKKEIIYRVTFILTCLAASTNIFYLVETKYPIYKNITTTLREKPSWKIIQESDPYYPLYITAKEIKKQNNSDLETEIEVYYMGGAFNPLECTWLEVQILYHFYPIVPHKIFYSSKDSNKFISNLRSGDILLSPDNLNLPEDIFHAQNCNIYFIYLKK